MMDVRGVETMPARSRAFDDDSPRVRETKRRITDCLFERMRDDPIERITVGEICAAAHINRSTFYHHFEDIYDVRGRCEARIEGEARQTIPSLMQAVLFGDSALVSTYFEEHMGPYYDYLDVLLNGGDQAFVLRMKAIAHESLQRLLHMESFSDQQELIFSAVAGMQLGMIGHWLSTGRSLPLPELLDSIGLLVREGPRAALLKERQMPSS